MDGYWVTRKWRAGPCGETIKFWVPGRKPARMTQQARRDIRKAAQNAASGIKMAARIVNASFCEGDALITLDYDTPHHDAMTRDLLPGMDAEDRETAIWYMARKNLQNTIRRARRAAAKDGVTLQYMCFTSDRDDKGGELVPCRVHHHIIASAEAAGYILAAWRDGGTNTRRLSAQPDYTPVVAYLFRQVRHVEDAKKYIASRGLVRPEPEDRIARTGGPIRPPKGAVLLDQGEYKPGEPQYIRYVLPDAMEDAETDESKGVVQVKTVKGHRKRRGPDEQA